MSRSGPRPPQPTPCPPGILAAVGLNGRERVSCYPPSVGGSSSASVRRRCPRHQGVVMSRSAVLAIIILSLGPAACASSQPPSGTPSSVAVKASGSRSATLRPCRAAVSTCQGELAAGTYPSTRTDLFGTGKPGQVSVTVPQGWANTLDHQPAYWLRPAEDYYADPDTDGNGTSSGIYVWGDVAAARQGGVCAEISDPAVHTDARSLAKWMRGIKGVNATPRSGEVLSGLTATVMDLQLGANP